jgi:flagellar biogenesis protein FliO
MLLARISRAASAPAGALGNLGTDVHELPFPSLARLVIAFLLTVGLALGGAWALRRWRPSFISSRSSAGRIRPLERRALSATLTIHLVEIEGVRFVVAEARGAVSLRDLASSRPQPEEIRV